jgi:SAM-dependent methyltransferase
MSAYDELPYPGRAHPETHPDSLATVATLFGLRPAPVERCRVLELGCGDGANLIPMAAGLPASAFVGIDLAARPIAEGRAAVAALGLGNCALDRMDLLAAPADWGRFDYIIAHGLYSWVAPEVQAGMLAVLGRHLSPDGVAFVSFNALPGWRLFGLVRDFLLYHIRAVTGPAARAEAARRLLETLAATAPESTDPYANQLHYVAGQLAGELASQGEAGAAFLFHDIIAEVNEPLHLHELAERAARHGLYPLAPAEFPAGAATPSRALADAVDPPRAPALQRRQYEDFLSGTAFHRLLLCRQPDAAERPIESGRLADLCVAAPVRPAGGRPAPATEPTAAEFETIDGARIAVAEPIARAALLHLGRVWPRAEPFAALVAAARAGLGPEADGADAPASARRLAEALLRAHLAEPSVVRLHAYAPRVATVAGERPVASPAARLAARVGPRIPNVYHHSYELDAWLRAVVLFLDGSRDRPALLTELTQAVADGRLDLAGAEALGADPAAVRAVIGERLEPTLWWLTHAALLVE